MGIIGHPDQDHMGLALFSGGPVLGFGSSGFNMPEYRNGRK